MTGILQVPYPARPIILFRFHDRPLICRSRILSLRELNSGVPIYGLYGGPPEGFEAMSRELGSLLDGLHMLKGKTAFWQWKHGDLAVREWFRTEGVKIDFDLLHLVSWDLLLAQPLAAWMGQIPAGTVALTSLTTVESVAAVWDWVRDEPGRGEWLALLQWAKRKHGHNAEPHCCLAPAYSLPRAFLERFAAGTVLELAHDELRLPLLAQCFGFSLCDTGLTPNSVAVQDSLFHCGREEIDPALVALELENPAGRRAFHPFRRSFP